MQLYLPDDLYELVKARGLPASELLKKAAGVPKGSGTNRRAKVGSISRGQLQEIATMKMQDLNANDVEGAMRIIEGTARSIGIDVGA